MTSLQRPAVPPPIPPSPIVAAPVVAAPVVTALVAALLLAVPVLVAGCGTGQGPGATSATGPRPLTEAEADRLALSRFGNYRAGGLHVTAQVSSGSGPLRLDGDVDTRAHVGYAAVAFTDVAGVDPTARPERTEVAVLRWTPATLDLWLGVGDGHAPPPTLPAQPPQTRPLRPDGSTLDTVLRLLLSLATDRPENPLLLRQSDARWLRSDTLRGVPVDVFRGPSATPQGTRAGGGSLRYWLDGAGRLLRVDADLAATPDSPPATVTVDLDVHRYVPVPPAPPPR